MASVATRRRCWNLFSTLVRALARGGALVAKDCRFELRSCAFRANQGPTGSALYYGGTAATPLSTIEDTRFLDAIQEIMMGDAWGSMDITEPNAGSDMAALRTRVL